MAEHTGYSLRNKLKVFRQQLHQKSNDLASIFSLKYKSRSKVIELELLVMICSLFPDDFRIPIQDLVTYVMGLGLFGDVHDMFATRCRVHDIISIINNRKYPRKAIGGQIRLAHEKDGPLNQYVKLLVGSRDGARSIASRYPLVFRREIVIGKWPESNCYEDCYGLSLVLKKVDEHPVNLEFPNLTLLQLQCWEDSQSFLIDFFRSMKELRVLSLDLPSLPHSLNVLRNLRTLCLKVPRFEDMSWIGGLINLEFLSVSVLSLTDVPAVLGQLENLRLLDLRKMNIAYIPPSVLSRLLKLEELYLPLNFQKWGCKAKKHDDYDEWESGEEDNYEDGERVDATSYEIDGGGRINASLIEIASLSLNSLQICVPKASLLPKKSPIFKSIREFNIFLPYNALYQPFGKYPMNVLQLTGEACDIKESGICDLLSKAEDLSLISVQNLRSVFYQLEDRGFPQLKKMIISECSELDYVVETPEKQIFDDCFLRKLECLHLSMLPNLKEILHGRWKYLGWFSNLSQVSIRFCPKLTYVFPLSIVRGLTLKSIEILDCYEMEGIFYEDSDDGILPTVSLIEKLELHSLPSLISFLTCQDDKFDGVKNDINQPLTTNEISVMGNEDVVSHMEIYSAFLSRFTVNCFQNLKSLTIAFCDLVKVVFMFKRNQATSKAFNSLEVLELHGLRNLVHIWFQIPPKVASFKNLRLLILSECAISYLFSHRVAKLMVQLQKIYISRCEKMEGIVIEDIENGEKGRLVLPRLKLLELQHMANLEILFGVSCEIDLPLLESLKLKQCNKIKSMSEGLLKIPMLKGIEVNGSFHLLTKDHSLIFTGVPTLHNFTFADLKIATKNFSSDNILGEGGSGKVYKGWIDRKTFAPSKTSIGMLVAVKRYNKIDSDTVAGVEREVGILQRLSHPNLVKLLGHCFEDKESALVYEYIPGKTLYESLFTRNPRVKPLSWDVRVKIAIGAARGLNYLHTSQPTVIHRDIKPHNILLDTEHNSKIADFGLAIWGPSDGNSHVIPTKCNGEIFNFGFAEVIRLGESLEETNTIMGTLGYIAPDYAVSGRVSLKTDVYSFGVVLLELMTGLKACDHERPEEQIDLVFWLKTIFSEKRELKDIMDSAMEGQYSSKAMLLMAELASKCTEEVPNMRPTMGEVLGKLHEIDPIKQKDKRKDKR